MNIKKYIRVYKTLLSLNLSALTAYRGGFYAMLASSIVWGSFQYISVLLLTSRVKNVFGWNRNELIILTAAYSFFWGIFHLVLARNFSRISRIIDYGELDLILVKPMDSQFLMSFWVINFTGLFRVILGIIVLSYMLSLTHTVVTIINVVGFFVLGLCGLTLIYSFWYITATSLIWYPRLSNLIELLYNVTGITRYPPQIVYEAKNFVLFFLLPLTFAMATPTKVLLNKVLWGDVTWLLMFTVVFFLVSRWFWKFALRFYTSASG